MTASEHVSRTEARTRALEILFAADVRDGDPARLLAEGGTSDTFTETLVDVVIEHRTALDELITTQAEGWTLDRMPAVDRNVLRLGLAEMLYVEEVPAKVAIDEAVELAKALSTDSSPRFVNGVLAAIARDRGLL